MPKVETFDREQVLLNATMVFHKKGYNGTSMQDLVDATNLNRSSIYNSFGSKLGMFMQVLSHYQKTTNSDLGKKISTTYNAIDTIRAVFEVTLQYILNDNDQKGCLIINCKSEMTNQDSTIKSFIEQNQDRMIAMLEDIVTKGQMERLFNQEQSASQYALYLYSSFQGLRMTGIIHKNEEELKSLINTIIKVLQ